MRAALAVVLLGYAVAEATFFHHDSHHRNVWFLAVATVLFAAAVLLLARMRTGARATAWLVIGVAAVLQLIAVTRAPLTSDDANRYEFDATVQFSGTDPYRYAPSAPQLAHLRDPSLFGPTSACTYPFPGGCTAINRPTVHTIYPPVAQATFDLGRVVSFGGHGGLLVYQLLAALGAVAVTVLLVRRALARGTPVWPAALWGWCPVIVSEFGNNAHVDWLAVLLTALAIQASAARRDLAAGVLVGAAIATKLYPVLVLPALLRRRPWLVPVTALATVLVVYVPHVLAVGSAVVGYLPGYLNEEGYASGSRLLLLGRLVPHPFDTAVGALVLVAVAYWAWRHSDAGAPEQTATVLTGAAILVTTPAYGWYAALLIALAVMSARYEWIVLSLAPSFVYVVHNDVTHWRGLSSIIYAVGALGTLLAWRLRTARARPPQAPNALRTVASSASR